MARETLQKIILTHFQETAEHNFVRKANKTQISEKTKQ